MREDGKQPPARMVDAFIEAALIHRASGNGYQLTFKGKEFVDDYVALTGDGPEDLKKLLSF